MSRLSQIFGPLTIRPDLWDRGIAQLLLAPTMDLFDRWGIRHAGLFTFASSAKHVGLYQKFGFWPRFLNGDHGTAGGRDAPPRQWTPLPVSIHRKKQSPLAEGLPPRGHVFDFLGLDVEREIRAVDEQLEGTDLGTLAWTGTGLAGLAVCHAGPGTEAGVRKMLRNGVGAVRCGPSAAANSCRLLDASCDFAAARALQSSKPA